MRERKERIERDEKIGGGKKRNKTEYDGYTNAIVAYGTCNLRRLQHAA